MRGADPLNHRFTSSTHHGLLQTKKLTILLLNGCVGFGEDGKENNQEKEGEQEEVENCRSCSQK